MLVYFQHNHNRQHLWLQQVAPVTVVCSTVSESKSHLWQAAFIAVINSIYNKQHKKLKTCLLLLSVHSEWHQLNLGVSSGFYVNLNILIRVRQEPKQTKPLKTTPVSVVNSLGKDISGWNKPFRSCSTFRGQTPALIGWLKF